MKIFSFITIAFVVIALTNTQPVSAHAVANTLMTLTVRQSKTDAEIRIPVSALTTSIGKDVSSASTVIPEDDKKLIGDYVISHTAVSSSDNKAWKTTITDMSIDDASDPTNGDYEVVVVHMVFTPPEGSNSRIFTLTYDAIIKEDSSHAVLVSVRDSWSDTIGSDLLAETDVIQADANDGTIAPLTINVENGNLWRGFQSMVGLGMEHIKEGTDHLLFLFTLLLPAPLIVIAKRWTGFVGRKKTFLNILKITTAFTIGHSITLIIGTLIHTNIPSQPIEALIAVSIIVSALHALRPLFPRKEVFIAGGFGLIHGMAFSFTLSGLGLDTPQLVISLLGFNVGIELMQLIIIALTIPSLIILAQTRVYRYIRIIGASTALIAAIGWVFARLGYPNVIGSVADSLSAYAVWIIVLLGAMAMTVLIKRMYYSRPAVDE